MASTLGRNQLSVTNLTPTQFTVLAALPAVVSLRDVVQKDRATLVQAEEVVVEGEVRTEGQPLTILCRTLRFLTGASINADGKPAVRSFVPDLRKEGPHDAGAPGVDGDDGSDGLQGGIVDIQAQEVIGTAIISSRGGNGGRGQDGGNGRVGAEGPRGQDAKTYDDRNYVPPQCIGGRGGAGGAVGLPGRSGRGGAGGKVLLRTLKALAAAPQINVEPGAHGAVAAPGNPGAGGLGGAGGDVNYHECEYDDPLGPDWDRAVDTKSLADIAVARRPLGFLSLSEEDIKGAGEPLALESLWRAAASLGQGPCERHPGRCEGRTVIPQVKRMTLFIDLRASDAGGITSASASVFEDGTTLVSPTDFRSRVAGRNLLLATHGFNVNRRRGVESLSLWNRAAALNPKVLFVGILWPGDAVLPIFVDYVFEGVEAIASGKLLASFLNENATGADSLTFASHSLGARMVLETIRWTRRPVREAVLMAAAIENNCLEREYADAARRVAETTVVSSTQDLVLQLAFPIGNLIGQIVMHGEPYTRTALGRHGVARPVPDSLTVDSWSVPDAWDYGHLDYLPCRAVNNPYPVPMPNPGPESPVPTLQSQTCWKPTWSAVCVTCTVPNSEPQGEGRNPGR